MRNRNRNRNRNDEGEQVSVLEAFIRLDKINNVQPIKFTGYDTESRDGAISYCFCLVRLLGSYEKTRYLLPSTNLIINEKLYFNFFFENEWKQDDLADFLESQVLEFELVQITSKSEITDDGGLATDFCDLESASVTTGGAPFSLSSTSTVLAKETLSVWNLLFSSPGDFNTARKNQTFHIPLSKMVQHHKSPSQQKNKNDHMNIMATNCQDNSATTLDITVTSSWGEMPMNIFESTVSQKNMTFNPRISLHETYISDNDNFTQVLESIPLPENSGSRNLTDICLSLGTSCEDHTRANGAPESNNTKFALNSGYLLSENTVKSLERKRNIQKNKSPDVQMQRSGRLKKDDCICRNHSVAVQTDFVATSQKKKNETHKPLDKLESIQQPCVCLKKNHLSKHKPTSRKPKKPNSMPVSSRNGRRLVRKNVKTRKTSAITSQKSTDNICSSNQISPCVHNAYYDCHISNYSMVSPNIETLEPETRAISWRNNDPSYIKKHFSVPSSYSVIKKAETGTDMPSISRSEHNLVGMDIARRIQKKVEEVLKPSYNEDRIQVFHQDENNLIPSEISRDENYQHKSSKPPIHNELFGKKFTKEVVPDTGDVLLQKKSDKYNEEPRRYSIDPDTMPFRSYTDFIRNIPNPSYFKD